MLCGQIFCASEPEILRILFSFFPLSTSLLLNRIWPQRFMVCLRTSKSSDRRLSESMPCSVSTMWLRRRLNVAVTEALWTLPFSSPVMVVQGFGGAPSVVQYGWISSSLFDERGNHAFVTPSWTHKILAIHAGDNTQCLLGRRRSRFFGQSLGNNLSYPKAKLSSFKPQKRKWKRCYAIP